MWFGRMHWQLLCTCDKSKAPGQQNMTWWKIIRWLQTTNTLAHPMLPNFALFYHTHNIRFPSIGTNLSTCFLFGFSLPLMTLCTIQYGRTYTPLFDPIRFDPIKCFWLHQTRYHSMWSDRMSAVRILYIAMPHSSHTHSYTF